MADGMLLNFDLGDGVVKTTQKFKGGTWKDRLSIKKIALHRQNKSKDPNPKVQGRGGQKDGPANPNRVEISSPRPPKRQKVDGDFKPYSVPSLRADGHIPTSTKLGNSNDSGNTQGNQAHKNQNQPREVISSLFSFNPTPVSAVEPPKPEGAEPAKPSNAPLIDRIDTFTSLGLSQTLAAHLMTKLELKAPTAIQKRAISQLLKEECDAFIQAQTGSGKTLAYLLPLVQRLINLSRTNEEAFERANQDSSDNTAVHRDSGLFAIILAPTRELCKQIFVVLEQLLRCAHWIVAGTVIGGEKKKSEKARLRKGLNILVATPGRLADHLENTKVLDVSNVRWLVLDEGDRLMDLGFEEEIQKIVRKLDERQRSKGIPGLPTKRATILCSATLKMNVQRLGDISLKDAVHVQADQDDEDGEMKLKSTGSNPEFSVPAQLKQSYAVVAAKLRLVTLTALMKRTFSRKGSVMKTIIFVSCADSVDFHFEVFSRQDSDNKSGEKEAKTTKASPPDTKPASIHGTIAKSTAFSNPTNPVTIYKLHGSLPQHIRTSTLSAFSRQSEAAVLICTDVAARGLDLPNVDFVVEYDPAFSSDDHLHRIGRTARLGRDGRAHIFLLPGNEEKYVEILKQGYRDSGAKISHTDVNETLKRGFGGNTETTSKGWEDKATEWQLDVERWALENPTVLEMARRAYQSHIRAYATHIASERDMFNIKDLHLGHLAKSFALRDRPAKINVPGLRPGKEDTKREFKADRKGTRDGVQVNNATSASDAVRKMREKVKEHMAGANEFNIA
ncbi:ATP-dependent RNA helicase DBP7 [Histoplasma capsulatum H143]|uniref:ATP-dependent RNA helicase n=1 Tax=Ajellomyces capsulatus (strain H143) TaxID=544712 RepID=C6HM92_AJECH|nr:ATP-dependent RNA helicase DBP7 [Histoplasma capsulatum H143]